MKCTVFEMIKSLKMESVFDGISDQIQLFEFHAFLEHKLDCDLDALILFEFESHSVLCALMCHCKNEGVIRGPYDTMLR